MKMKRIFILSFLLLGACALIAQESFKTETSVMFKIKNFGMNVDGHFSKIEIKAIFNNKDILEDISGSIDVSSISTGMAARDKHILEEDYFHMEKYENIELKTISLKRKTSENYLLTAELTIKGISKQIIIPIQLAKTENWYEITSNFEINRKDFDIGGGSLVLSKWVKINVKHHQYY